MAWHGFNTLTSLDKNQSLIAQTLTSTVKRVEMLEDKITKKEDEEREWLRERARRRESGAIR